MPEGTTNKRRRVKGVASIAISAVSSDGKPFVIKLEIGKPYHCDTDEWACPVSLRGLYDRLEDMRGVDSFQALCMAVSLVHDLLQDFREKGGKLLMDGENFPLEAYALTASR